MPIFIPAKSGGKPIRTRGLPVVMRHPQREEIEAHLRAKDMNLSEMARKYFPGNAVNGMRARLNQYRRLMECGEVEVKNPPPESTTPYEMDQQTAKRRALTGLRSQYQQAMRGARQAEDVRKEIEELSRRGKSLEPLVPKVELLKAVGEIEVKFLAAAKQTEEVIGEILGIAGGKAAPVSVNLQQQIIEVIAMPKSIGEPPRPEVVIEAKRDWGEIPAPRPLLRPASPPEGTAGATTGAVEDGREDESCESSGL